jgi:hypothetical protein
VTQPISFDVVRQGNEQEPVVVVDNFEADPEQLIEIAAAQTYRTIGPFFPGVRAPLAPTLIRSIRERVAGIIRETFGLSGELNRMESYFSLVTTPPHALAPLQRLPHFDGLGRERIAMLHHLGRAEKGGTAFFRHRSTGYETMTAERFATYGAAVNREVAGLGLPARYMTADMALFEQIAHYPARFNRLLIYRGNTLHSGDIPQDLALTPDPRTGRFSINTFLWLEPEAAASPSICAPQR